MSPKDFTLATKIAVENNYTVNEVLPNLYDSTSTARDKPVFIVAIAYGQVIGFMGFRSTNMDMGSYCMFWFMVDPKFQRQGVGKAMMQYALGHLREQRAGSKWNVMLITSKPDYFQRFGFTSTATLANKKSLMLLEA